MGCTGGVKGVKPKGRATGRFEDLNLKSLSSYSQLLNSQVGELPWCTGSSANITCIEHRQSMHEGISWNIHALDCTCVSGIIY